MSIYIGVKQLQRKIYFYAKLTILIKIIEITISFISLQHGFYIKFN